jgi:hypothetical protein
MNNEPYERMSGSDYFAWLLITFHPFNGNENWRTHLMGLFGKQMSREELDDFRDWMLNGGMWSMLSDGEEGAEKKSEANTNEERRVRNND